jgi:selenocysteine-specific elongation factor
MIVGTAGHIDHGKTALVKALTGVETDRLKEEKARGITIDLGYAYTPLPHGEVLGFVDVPGHERFVHNMLAGATGIDYVLLVVAADDGVMPQTREHLQILDLLGLARGAVVLSKCDRVAAPRVAEVADEVAALLAGTALAGSPVFPVSSLSGEGIFALRQHLEQQSVLLPQRDPEAGFRLAIDRAFTLAGAGTVVTGTVHTGRVRLGDTLLLSPSGKEVRVRGIHAQNRPDESGRAGQRCAINLAGVAREEVERGDWLVAPTLHEPVSRIDVQLHLLATEVRSLQHWTPVHFHLGAAHVTGRVALLEAETLAPGTQALAQVVLDRAVGALHGDRFVIRDQSATRTLGGGRVLDPFPPPRGKRAPGRLSLLRTLAGDDAEASWRACLDQSPWGASWPRFVRACNLGEQQQARILRAVPTHGAEFQDGSAAFLERRWQDLKQSLLHLLARRHDEHPDELGLAAESLRRHVAPQLARPVFNLLCQDLLATGALARSGNVLHLPGRRVSLSPADEKRWSVLMQYLVEAPFDPPRVRDMARAQHVDEAEVRRLLRRLEGMGKVYQVAHDHFFLPDAVARMADIAAELERSGDGARAASFRDRIGTGRKVAIQILEFFDRVGYTRRAGDAHRQRSGFQEPWR